MRTSIDVVQEARPAGSLSLKTSLLDLFSRREQRPATRAGREQLLWSVDAVHRANNLAQMAASLGSSGLRHLHGSRADGSGAQARALSRAYAELANADLSGASVPCGPLLEAIARGLTSLFGGEQPVQLQLSIDDILMATSQRRPLILIASELIINALKYAFPAAEKREISIGLRQADSGTWLVVSDTGCGLLGEAVSGVGSGVMQEMAALLSADMRRENNDPGLKVSLFVPIGSP